MKLVLLLLQVTYFVALSDNSIKWGYRSWNGPATWNGICASGRHQSPVNIDTSDTDRIKLGKILFEHYEYPGPIQIQNNGHSVELSGFVKWSPDNRPYIHGGPLNNDYLLETIHFHWGNEDQKGSEHAIDSRHYPVEIHLVHRKRGNISIEQPDNLAVVAVFLKEVQKGGGTAFDHLEEHMEKLKEYNKTVKLITYTPTQMLPADRERFYTYRGSLTTPECNETVIWTILAEPSSINQKQLSLLRQVWADDGKPFECNCRPVQLLNGRRIGYRVSSFLDRHGTALAWVLSVLAILAILFGFICRIRKARRRSMGGPQIGEEQAILLDQ